jgi:phosphoesterase RecJ-like protein
MYLSYPEAKMRVLAVALQNLRVEKPLAWMWVTEADLKRSGAREEDAEGLVNYALGMDGVEVAAFFRPTAGGYRVSLRSKDGFEVSPIAEEFGGGGHRQASGFSQPGPLESIMPRVLGRIRACLATRAGAASPVSSSAGTARRTKLNLGTAAATTARPEPSSTGEI